MAGKSEDITSHQIYSIFPHRLGKKKDKSRISTDSINQSTGVHSWNLPATAASCPARFIQGTRKVMKSRRLGYGYSGRLETWHTVGSLQVPISLNWHLRAFFQSHNFHLFRASVAKARIEGQPRRQKDVEYIWIGHISSSHIFSCALY